MPRILSLSINFQPSESGRKAGLSMNGSYAPPTAHRPSYGPAHSYCDERWPYHIRTGPSHKGVVHPPASCQRGLTHNASSFSSSQLHPRPAHPSSSMVTPKERPDHRRDRHDRAIPSAELPFPEAASSSTAQTSMSARARRASASPSRPVPSEHAIAKCCTCTGLHTGTLRG